MSVPVVPGNAFQRKLKENDHSHLRPDAFVARPARCVIEKVYDPQTLKEEGVENELAVPLLRHPGFLWARVRLIASRATLVLPFEKDAAEILSQWGNSLMLEGLPAKVVYYNTDKNSGRIVMTSNPTQKIRHPDDLIGVASIVDIF